MNVHEDTVFLIFSQKILNGNCLIGHIDLFGERLGLKILLFIIFSYVLLM